MELNYLINSSFYIKQIVSINRSQLVLPHTTRMSVRQFLLLAAKMLLLAFQDVKTIWTIKSYQVPKETILALRWNMNLLPKRLNLLFVIKLIDPCAHLQDYIDIISIRKSNVRKATKSIFSYLYIGSYYPNLSPLLMIVWSHRDMFHPAPSLYTSC